MAETVKIEAEINFWRTTFDGYKLLLWSDGLVTDIVGNQVRGLGRRRLPADCLASFAGEVCLMSLAEVPSCVDRVRAAVKRGTIADPGAMRDAIFGPAPARLAPKALPRRRDEKNCPAHGTLAEHILHCRRVFGCRVCG